VCLFFDTEKTDLGYFTAAKINLSAQIRLIKIKKYNFVSYLFKAVLTGLMKYVII
jgi:hypothetical protein